MALHPFLVKTGLYKPFLALTRKFSKVHAYMSYLKWVDAHRGKGLINDYYNPKAAYPQRFNLHNTLLDKAGLRNQAIQYYEFGVAKGDMIRHWSTENQHPDSRFTGFDSFEGLPEGWEDKKQGHFDQKGNFPDIQDSRVHFVKGWFQDTAYNFLKDANFKGQCVYHLDADLFSSTIYILFQIHPFLKPGDVLIFDEYSSHEHEHLAFEIFQKSAARTWKYELLGAVNNFRQVAFRIV